MNQDGIQRLLAPPGREVRMSGMEALVRGLLEAGVSYATGYPGGPASVDKVLCPMLEAAGEDCGLRFEWSVNEAVLASKVLGRATLTNARSFGFMKNIGLNVASDAFFSMCVKSTYNSGVLFLVAADPQPHRSQTSQDNRYVLSSTHVPLLEPGSPQEVLDLTRDAFQLSEKYRFPFFMHMNPLILDTVGALWLGDFPPPSKADKRFIRKGRMDFITISYHYPQDVSRRLQQLAELSRETAERWVDLNRPPRAGEVGIVSSGFFAPLIQQAQARCGTDFPVLRLKAAWPAYVERLTQFLSPLSGALVLEEGRPFLEQRVAALANSCNPGLPVWGKSDGFTVEGAGALTEETVVRCLEFLKRPDKVPAPLEPTQKPWGRKANEEFFPVYLALHRVYTSPDQWSDRPFPIVVVTGTGDFGSYAIPQGWVDFKFHMGSSFPIAGGLAEATATEQDGASGEAPVVVTFSGDCSFFHSDFQGLVDNIQYQKPVLHVICDNKGSGMTGGQEIVGQDIGRLVDSMEIHWEGAGMEDIVALSQTFSRLLDFVRSRRRPALLHVRA